MFQFICLFYCFLFYFYDKILNNIYKKKSSRSEILFCKYCTCSCQKLATSFLPKKKLFLKMKLPFQITFIKLHQEQGFILTSCILQKKIATQMNSSESCFQSLEQHMQNTLLSHYFLIFLFFLWFKFNTNVYFWMPVKPKGNLAAHETNKSLEVIK